MLIIITISSIIIQLTSSFLAIRLIKLTNHSKAWILVSIALFLMATRRMIILAVAGGEDINLWIDLLEINGLIISLLMLFGMLKIKKLFQTIQTSSEQQQKLTAIVEETSDYVGTIDTDFNLIYLNKAGRRLIGLDENIDIKGKSLEFVHGKDSVKFLKNYAIPSAIENKGWKGENSFIKVDGTVVYVSQVILPHFDHNNKLVQLSTICRDISNEKKVKDELININEAKDKFFSIIAHDLKSPLGAVKSAMELLISDFDALSNEEIKEFLESMNNSIKNDYALLENLLYWSRLQINKGQFTKTQINLLSITQLTVDLLERNANQKNILIETDIDNKIEVFADANMVQLIIRNLLTNAIKFSQFNSKIIISARINKDTVTVSVQDFGVGIPKEKISDLFKFAKIYSTAGTNNEIGTGLGLHLCFEFMQKHSDKNFKSDIWVNSEQSKGTTFYFTLPTKEIE